jgi:hypothetical protein
MKSKIVKENLTDYLEKKFPQYPGEFDEFEKRYRENKMPKDSSGEYDKVIYSEDDWKIIKNPTSISYIDSSSRGVVTKNGDLYIENNSGSHIHNDILLILYKKGILKGEFKKGWGKKLPTETGFLTVQRYKDTKYIAIGESNKIIYNEGDWEKLSPLYDKFLEPVRKKNPNLTFTNKLVGFKFFKRAENDEEGYNSKNNTLKEDINTQKNLIKNFL